MRLDIRTVVAFVALIGLIAIQPALGQQPRVADPQDALTVALDAELPIDPALRTGTLANGLTTS